MRTVFVSFILILAISAAAIGQTNEFTYQGRLLDNGLMANGLYDFEFKIYDTASNGNLIGTITRQNVQVTTGLFTVRLQHDSAFNGDQRFLEIAVKPAGANGSFVSLAPRQPVTSTPYAIRSSSANLALVANSATSSTFATNAANLGGLPAESYVLDSDSRLSDDRMPKPGSLNYIQNGSGQQIASFNIAGSGNIGGNLSVAGTTTFNTVNSQTQYNVGGERVLGTEN
jgi:hypothetical protein